MPTNLSAVSADGTSWLELLGIGPRTTLGDGTPFAEWIELNWNRVTPNPEPEDPNAFKWDQRPKIEERFVGPSVWLRLAVHNGRPEVDELKLTRRVADPEITATTLSEIPLREIADATTEEIARLIWTFTQLVPGERNLSRNTSALDAVDRAGASALATRRRRIVTNELLEEVARVYQSDTVGAPTKAVKEHFFVSHRTATRYVSMAVDRGFLPRQGKDQKS